MLLYVRGHEGRGIGLGAKMNAYSLQDGAEKLDTVDANTRLGFAPDLRTYTECAEVKARSMHSGAAKDKIPNLGSRSLIVTAIFGKCF